MNGAPKTPAELLEVAKDVRSLIEQAGQSPDSFGVHVVLADRSQDRCDWIEIRTVWGILDLCEQIESTWFYTEFEVVHVDEDRL